jgi:hypothetical protein
MPTSACPPTLPGADDDRAARASSADPLAVQRLRRRGVISNWADSPYDLRRRRLSLAGAVNVIIICDETAATLRELQWLDSDCKRLVFGMRAHRNGAALPATDDDLDELIGVVAAEANHESNRRGQHRLDAAFTVLTDAAHTADGH